MKEAARACPERPARRQGTSEFVALSRSGRRPKFKNPPPGWKTPETVALERLRWTSGIEKTPQRAGFKEGSRPSLVDCNYQRTPFEVEIKELLCPISCSHAAVQPEIRRF